MALKIFALPKLMLSYGSLGVPLCSVITQRFLSDYLVLRSRSHLHNIKIKQSPNSDVLARTISLRHVHYMQEDSLVKSANHDREEVVVADDSDVENDSSEDEGTDTLFEKTDFSGHEWEKLILQLSQNPRYSRFPCYDGLIMKLCLRQGNYKLASSYLEFLQNQGKEPNLLALGCYLQLCGQSIAECGEEKVLDVYKELASRVKVFDVTLSEYAIIALTKTSQWKQAFNYLRIINRLCSVTPRIYSSLITAAFRNGEHDTGWQLMETMCREEKEPLDETHLEWLKQCETAKDKSTMASFLFDKFTYHDFYPNVPVVKEIKSLYEREIGWSGMYVKIFNKGECPACGHHLINLDINEEDFARLKDEFVSRVLLGTDIFKSTSPEEWAWFAEFVKEEGPFAMVVDGLNIAYTAGKKAANVRMRRLREAVQKLKVSNRKGKILVIGRNHMIGWSPHDFEAIKRRAVVFTLDNISKDDGFMLYATLCSGLGTQFLSSDMLRDHVFRLQDAKLRETFRHWQRRHQILAVAVPEGVKLVPPPSFKTASQRQGETGWHIPYNDGSSRESYEVPHTWLCLQAKPHHPEQYESSKNVSKVAFECLPEAARMPHQHNPENSESSFITLTGELLGSQKTDSKPLDIQYGKINTRSKENKLHSQTEWFNNRNHAKSMGAKSKMKEDMMKIVSNNKQRQRQYFTGENRKRPTGTFESRGFSEKREHKSDKKVFKLNKYDDEFWK